MGSSPQPDRYEPLPGLLQIPGFLWRKLGPRGRRAGRVLGVVLAAGIAVGLIRGVPAIVHAKRQSAAADARATARYRAGRLAELRRQARPLEGRGPAAHGLTAPATLGPQRVLRADLVAAIAADAARRARTGEFVRAPSRIECQGLLHHPGDPDPSTRPGAPAARYSCLAVTTRIARGASTNGGVIGYPYAALVDFPRGRFGFCRISGRPGEMLIGRDLHVDVPRACGGP